MIERKTRAIGFVVGAALVGCALGPAAVPSFAQTVPAAGRWSTGPGASGDNTYVGRIESPRTAQTVSDEANLLVSGWAADTTARGWAGFDALEIWSGDKDASSGKKLANGTVGLTRPDMGDAMGTMTFARSGFNAVVPASTLANLGTGSQGLNVYLHTPAKGWWHRSISVNLTKPAASSSAEEPINVFLRPLDNTIISQKQKFEKYSLFGYALDQTPITDPQNQTLGSCECGISSVTIYVDSIDREHNLGTAGLRALIAFANKGKPASQTIEDFSPVSREYGDQYDRAGWVFSINPRTLSADWHTFYAVARSSITGKTSTASVTMFIKDTPDDGKIIAP
jgi:hypothetical protein